MHVQNVCIYIIHPPSAYTDTHSHCGRKERLKIWPERLTAQFVTRRGRPHNFLLGSWTLTSPFPPGFLSSFILYFKVAFHTHTHTHVHTYEDHLDTFLLNDYVNGEFY